MGQEIKTTGNIGSVAIAGFGGVCYFGAFYYISAGLKVTCYLSSNSNKP